MKQYHPPKYRNFENAKEKQILKEVKEALNQYGFDDRIRRAQLFD